MTHTLQSTVYKCLAVFYGDITAAVLHRLPFDFKPCLRLQLTVAPLANQHGV